jgi:hypothetical protein
MLWGKLKKTITVLKYLVGLSQINQASKNLTQKDSLRRDFFSFADVLSFSLFSQYIIDEYMYVRVCIGCMLKLIFRGSCSFLFYTFLCSQIFVSFIPMLVVVRDLVSVSPTFYVHLFCTKVQVF